MLSGFELTTSMSSATWPMAVVPGGCPWRAEDAALDVDERVNACDRLQRDQGDLVGRSALADDTGDVGELEELAPEMAPAERARHRPRDAIGPVEVVVAAIGVGPCASWVFLLFDLRAKDSSSQWPGYRGKG